MSDLIARAAWFFERDQGYVASALAAYQQQHGLDDAALITYLDCPRERLAALALVRRPDPAASDFSDRVADIAAYIGCHPDRLTSLLAERPRTSTA